MENDGTDSPGVSRREFLERVAAGGAGLAVAGGLARPGAPAWAAKGSVTLADVGVGDPGGDWSKFSGPTGWDVKLVAMGNAPSGCSTSSSPAEAPKFTTSSTSSAGCRSRWSRTT